jgi:hypothetical protein
MINMTPTPEQPQQKLEDYLKSCNDREYAEYIIATMTHGNSPSDFDKIQKEAIQAIRSRPITPAQKKKYANDVYARLPVNRGLMSTTPPSATQRWMKYTLDMLTRILTQIITTRLMQKRFISLLNPSGAREASNDY